MLYTKPVEIGPPVPEKKIFEVFYHIKAWRSFGHVTSFMLKNFHFLTGELSYKIWLRSAQ